MPRILGLQETGARAGQFAPGRLFIILAAPVGRHGVLLFNSGQYNRSVLISAIRVARAGSRFWATPRLARHRGVTIVGCSHAHARSRGGHGFGPTIGRANGHARSAPTASACRAGTALAALSTSPPKSRAARSDTSGILLINNEASQPRKADRLRIPR